MDFVKKGVVSAKYLADGCEFKKQNEDYKLVSTQNPKFQPFVGKVFSQSVWDLISQSDITSGEKWNKMSVLLIDHFKSGQTIFSASTNLLLKKDERIIYLSPGNIILKEPKTIRVTNSSHAGTAEYLDCDNSLFKLK
ncbi:hypothetical protein TL18_04500 [Methanobrevibacter sp. YE315]|uniref:hypothetical protein n=1 Tax=Methanobrevibacter sp. YE315 TaxID=1609968 RepID=UPI000764E0AE|nr:hypothetical protein [Methanobrevibacter sp. YE315]AMD17347.1 hypothetical protein TL18_04500 [Methanobrevibacter sp. YE315]